MYFVIQSTLHLQGSGDLSNAPRAERKDARAGQPNLADILEGYYNCKNMVELKVRKFGNSLGVVLPKKVIDRLQTSDGERLFLVEAPDGAYQLTPYDPAFEKKMTAAEDIIRRYRNTLRALAK